MYKRSPENVKTEFSLNFHVYTWHFNIASILFYARKNYAKSMTLPAKEGFTRTARGLFRFCYVTVQLHAWYAVFNTEEIREFKQWRFWATHVNRQ